MLDRVAPEMEIVRETFRPVAPVIRVRTLDDCIRIVTADNHRLSGAIVTASQDAARVYAATIRVGQFSWNRPPGYRTESAPFGGFGDSGNGEKEGIVDATAPCCACAPSIATDLDAAARVESQVGTDAACRAGKSSAHLAG